MLHRLTLIFTFKIKIFNAAKFWYFFLLQIVTNSFSLAQFEYNSYTLLLKVSYSSISVNK